MPIDCSSLGWQAFQLFIPDVKLQRYHAHNNMVGLVDTCFRRAPAPSNMYVVSEKLSNARLAI